MASQQWADEDRLMAALAEALQAERDVPREFIDAGQAAFTWHSIDAELAALTFDSETETMAAAVRSAEAAPRFLTFTAGRRSPSGWRSARTRSSGRSCPRSPATWTPARSGARR